MKNLKYQIELFTPEKIIEICQVDIVVESDCHITVTSSSLGCLDAKGSSLFDTFCHIRNLAEPKNFKFLCNGARKDAFPSPMLQSAIAATKIYLHRDGSPSTRDDLVDFFGHADFEQIGNVAEQERNHKLWLKTLL
jgi:hypothetical protein